MPTETIDYTPPAHKAVDPKIAHPLGRLRGVIRRYVSLEGALAVLLFLAAWFWLAMLLDYGVFRAFAFDWALEAHKGFRVVALVLAVGALLALVVTKVIIRLTRDFSDSSLALVLEKRFPTVLGDRLISAVQLADLEWSAKYGYSTDMIKKTIDDVRGKVDQIPVNSVFNWRRLWLQGGAFLALTVGFFLLSGIAVCAATRSSPGAFVHDFTDVSAILAERDVLLENTPWPRRAYLEVVNFPESGELRIGRDVPSPRLRVAAYQWVIADNKAPVGWRPLTWADLHAVGVSGPELPLQTLRDARFAVQYGPFLYGAAHPFAAPNLPTDVGDVPNEPSKWPVDRVEQVFVKSEDVRGILAKEQAALDGIDQAINALEQKAADPANSRKLRKLKIPDEVELSYWGAKTRVDMKLRAEANNEFAGTLSDLKETVKFHARGENYYTPDKQITLVPPPMLTELKRTEYHPAYLYHKAPNADAADLPEDQKPYRANPTLLKGLKHVLRDQAVSLTGDKSRFDIPTGAELVLTGKTDKELKEASILPKPGKFPGVPEEVADPDPIPLAIENGHDIKIEFTTAAHRRITGQTEFDLFLRDTDGVTSKRAVQIVVEEDRAPEVDVAVDVIRKVGGTYLCTPQAFIPFTKESKVRDDKGLNRVDYVYSYSEIEPLAVTLKRIEYASWFFNQVPVLPALNDPIYRAAAMIENLPRVRPSLATVSGRQPVPSFLREYTARGLPLAAIMGKLEGPRPAGAEQTVITLVDYRGIEDELELFRRLPEEDLAQQEFLYGFDLQKVAGGLKRQSENEAQRTYVLTLTVVAVDSNVEADRPGIGQNKESMTFKLVSDTELLTEVAREEAGLADKLEDAIRRLADVDNKLRSMAPRLQTISTPDQFVPEQTRATELAEQLAKSKDVTAEVFTDYTRILREYRVNRLSGTLIKNLDRQVVGPLGLALAADTPAGFQKTEDQFNQFHAEVSAGRQPAPALITELQGKLTVLLDMLRQIHAGIGKGLDVKKLATQLEEVIKQQLANETIIGLLKVSKDKELTQITLVPPANPVNVNVGQATTVRVPANVGPLYAGNFTLKLEPSPGSDLKVPAQITMKEDDRDVAIEIKAGANKGLFWVRVTPDVGPAKDVRVVVK